MNNPTVIITGANGFIGEYLVNYFSDKGWFVKAFVRTLPTLNTQNVVYVKYNLEGKPDEHEFKNTDYLIHCAYMRYDKDKNADDINIKGTKALIECCRRYAVKPVFISSFSAHSNAQSHYGKNKLYCEKLFNPLTDLIIKPGLVIGTKGLAAEIIQKIKTSSVFPLVGGGNQPLQTIAIDDLAMVIHKAVSKNFSGIYFVAEPEPISMKIFYQEIANRLNKKTMFISFPISVLFTICKASEAIGIKLPVSSESVLGLKYLKSFDTSESLHLLELKIKNYKQTLDVLLRS